MVEKGLSVKAVSSLWHSPAWPPGLGHPDYVNAAIEVETSLEAPALLNFLHQAEAASGRIRGALNAPRALDLDLLDYEGEVSVTYPLLPHPRLSDRPFVLLPLNEINPIWRHPVTNETPIKALAALWSKDVLSHHVIDRLWAESLPCVLDNQSV